MRPFSLARLLELAERRAEGLSRTVKRAHGNWLQARGHQVRLLALRDARVAEFAGRLRAGMSASQLQEMNRLLRAQSAEMRAVQAAVDATHETWQARLGEWLKVEQRVKALRLLRARHLAQLEVQQRRVEQRQHDELVALAHRRDAGRRVR